MELDQIRALAGLPAILTEKKKDDVTVPPADDVTVPPADGGGEKTEEEKLQEMLEAVAKKAEGKDAKALVADLRKVYDAGVKDGIAQCEAKKD